MEAQAQADSESETDTETETESDIVTASESDYDDENNSIIRAKWQMDGSRNLDECVAKLENFIAYLRQLKADGWELRDPVNDDYGYIRRSPTSSTS